MNKSKTVIPLQIEITDVITPKTCANFISELIKYIAFVKQQIPYPYERLKMFVLKRREQQRIFEESNNQVESKSSQRLALLMEKHYRKVEEAYKILDSTFRCIEHELMKSPEKSVEEIVLLFGATPVSPKDVYRIKIPTLNFGHSESQHSWRKQMGNLLRGIMISDEVNTNFQKKIGLTNMFILMKMKKSGCISSQWLLPKDSYSLSGRAPEVNFSFQTIRSKPCSCSINELEKVTQELTNLTITDGLINSEVHDFVWYQTSQTLKGFRDCKSEGKSIPDLWYKHRFL